jgi:hypothetical protein
LSSKSLFKTKEAFLFFLGCFISFLAACFLSFEYFLSLQGKSLCSTAACQIVSKYISIPEPLLIGAGASLFWCLCGLFYFFYKYQKKLFWLLACTLTVALAFDGSLIGYQFFTVHQRCALCITVAATLLLISSLFSLSKKSYTMFFCFILSWIGAFSANYIIEMPQPVGARSGMIFFQKNAEEMRIGENTQEITLIISMNCPHCLEVISFLVNHYQKDVTWKFATTDQDNDSLYKVAYFLEKNQLSNNPFEGLEQAKLIIPTHEYDIENLRKNGKNALVFLSNIGYSTVPLAIICTSKFEERFIIGSDAILAYFSKYFANKSLSPDSRK